MSNQSDQFHQTTSELTPKRECDSVSDGKSSDSDGKSSENRKPVSVDDGRTIANMNVEGMPWYRDPEEIEKHKKASKLRLTLKERFAIVWAAYRAYLPRFLVFFLGYLIVALAMYFFWLK